jgi:hypothetical protein
LTACHYPKEGSRHEFALALSGFLMRQGWDEARIRHFVTSVATEAGDEEIEDRASCCATTAERMAAGEKTIGGTRLREIWDGAVFELFCEWLGFAKPGRFELATVEADDVAPDEVPQWPLATLDGDYITELSYWLTTGTAIPPPYVREQIIAVLAALADGKLGYPSQPYLPLRRFLALISEYPQAGKGASWERLTGRTPEGGALCSLLGALAVLDGDGIGSGEFLARKLEENPRAIVHWDEASGLFQTAGAQNNKMFSAIKKLFEGNMHHSGSYTNKEHGGDNLRLSVLLHTTRQTFVDGFALRGGVGDGLLSRFTLGYSAGLPILPEWEPRNLAEEKSCVATLGKLIPKVPTAPKIAHDARERMKEFAIMLNSSDHRAYVGRIQELTKIDLVHRAVYSGSAEITLEMAERSITWGQHQLALRLAFWPLDASDKVAAMTQTLLRRLRKGSASANDLRRAGNADRDGTHELFNRALLALTRSRKVIVAGKNSKGNEVYKLEPEDV